MCRTKSKGVKKVRKFWFLKADIEVSEWFDDIIVIIEGMEARLVIVLTRKLAEELLKKLSKQLRD